MWGRRRGSSRAVSRRDLSGDPGSGAASGLATGQSGHSAHHRRVVAGAGLCGTCPFIQNTVLADTAQLLGGLAGIRVRCSRWRLQELITQARALKANTIWPISAMSHCSMGRGCCCKCDLCQYRQVERWPVLAASMPCRQVGGRSAGCSHSAGSAVSGQQYRCEAEKARLSKELAKLDKLVVPVRAS